MARQAAAAVGVGTCWSWETAATLPSARRREALGRPRGRRRAGHIVSPCAQLVRVVRINFTVCLLQMATAGLLKLRDFCGFASSCGRLKVYK